MVKRIFLGTIAVFAAWSVLSLVMHGLILGPSYAATAHLWRPPEEMNMALMNLFESSLLSSSPCSMWLSLTGSASATV